MADQEQGNIRQEYNNATIGLNMDQTPNQIKKGSLTYALNAAVENFDANTVNYQNEEGNEMCLTFPEGYVLIGTHFIQEKNKHIFFLVNPDTGDSHIGYMDNNDCTYKVLVNAPCLNFDINHPIHKCVHKITNCGTEIYWTDGFNPRRYLDIDDIPKILKSGTPLCSPEYTDDVDCNQLLIQPNFSIPEVSVTDVISGGNLIAGTYQFAVQYSDAAGNPYTSYYSVTNPTPIADPQITSVNFNYAVGKSIAIDVSSLDITGQFQYFNLAVIKTINGISSVELVGTYNIDSTSQQITYTGADVSAIRLSINDIFEKYPYYEVAQDVTTAQDILIWEGLTSIDRVNYQKIATNINLQWETWRIPANESYADEVNATNLRGYLRDEVYAFEIVFLLKNGKQTDGFHIPGRIKNLNEVHPDVPNTNPDFIGNPDYEQGGIGYSPYWKIYNTGSVTGFSPGYSTNPAYKGPYQYGEMAYWESEEEYPCNTEVWGKLAGQKIRHHKFPDVLVSPIFESKIFASADSMAMGNDAIFPIGIRVDIDEVASLIQSSNLTSEQKANIIGFKIVRGDRGTNKSIVAKGILRNVGIYEREEEQYYYPNYPYNDLREDPFLLATNNAYADQCKVYNVQISVLAVGGDGVPYANVTYTDCNNNKQTVEIRHDLNSFELCSATRPIVQAPAVGVVGDANYNQYFVWNSNIAVGVRVGWVDPVDGYKTVWLDSAGFDNGATINAIEGGEPMQVEGGGTLNIAFRGQVTSTKTCNVETPLDGIKSELRTRQIFNSPETSFGQPFLGSILKLENVMFGAGKAHFTEVKDNARYRLITRNAQLEALNKANSIAALSSPYDMTVLFSAYQSLLAIDINSIWRKNFAYSFNSVADYNYSARIDNNAGIKQRTIDISRYLIPGVQNVGDDHNINNFNRETSVFIKTASDILFPSDTPSINPGGTPIVKDESRFTISQADNCNAPSKEESIKVVSYYASLKNNIVNQWGQIYSYETIDTGFQKSLTDKGVATVFGGDTFIGRFAFKTKLPFFIDNRVNAPDDSDIFYDEIGNVAYPKYWHSARSVNEDYMSGGGLISNAISYKAHNFDCPNDEVYPGPVIVAEPSAGTTTTTTTTTTTVIPGTVTTDTSLTYYDGYFYLFAYGIPNFYCESSYNLDLRQAFNNREGDFWPHVSTGIPDAWLQESFVTIAQDNTYYYNVTFSKQNKENTFTHLPIDWSKPCHTYYPFRAIYSDPQQGNADVTVNAWLNYRALSQFDFPQNFGKLTSLDGIQNRAVLARFENKTLMYNSLMTIDTSNPQAAFVGNPNMFANPPIDFAETNLGYVGSQHKFLLKIPQGQISVDAKRGQVFLIAGQGEAIDLSGFGSGMNRFFTDHLAFEILRYFPQVDIDNHFNGIGLHGVYDSKYDRVILTKIDYIPHEGMNITYDSETLTFYLEEQVEDFIRKTPVELTDERYFCNKSWTVSYNMNTKSWISFHSYIPNWYIAENNFFYSGLNSCCQTFEFIVGVPGENTTTTTTTTAIPDCTIDDGTVGTTTTTTTTTTTALPEIFMMVGTEYDDNRILTTTDGSTWTAQNLGYATNMVRAINRVGNFWLIGGYLPDADWNDQDSMQYSNDGENWVGMGLAPTGQSPFSEQCNGIAYNAGRYVAVGAGTNTIAYSDDGLSWTGLGSTIFPGTYKGYGIAYGNGVWVALGDPNVNNQSIAYSTDNGLSFTVVSNMFAYYGTSAVWNGSIWVATGAGVSNGCLAYSSNGTSWTLNTYNGFNDLSGYANVYEVAYGNGIFVAVGGGNGAPNTIAWSNDGITWNGIGTSVFNNRGTRIMFKDGYFYATGLSSGIYDVYKSADGINWSVTIDIATPATISAIGPK